MKLAILLLVLAIASTAVLAQCPCTTDHGFCLITGSICSCSGDYSRCMNATTDPECEDLTNFLNTVKTCTLNHVCPDPKDCNPTGLGEGVPVEAPTMSAPESSSAPSTNAPGTTVPTMGSAPTNVPTVATPAKKSSTVALGTSALTLVAGALLL